MMGQTTDQRLDFTLHQMPPDTVVFFIASYSWSLPQLIDNVRNKREKEEQRDEGRDQAASKEGRQLYGACEEVLEESDSDDHIAND